MRGNTLEVVVRSVSRQTGTPVPEDGVLELVVKDSVALVDTVIVRGATGDLLRFDVHISDSVEAEVELLFQLENFANAA